MKLKIIKEKINGLKSLLPQVEDISKLQIKDAIILKYVQRVMSKLDDIVHKDSQDAAILIENFKCFLEENWELVKGNLLAYTALPTHATTLLLCDIAKYVAENEEQSAIHFLMPGIACVSISENYSDLDKMDVAEVLRTYILGKEGIYLLPVSLLTEEISLVNLPNPYFDYKTHAENSVSTSRAELKRLSEHSSEATVLYRLREDFIALSNDKSTLLGKLNELIRGLSFYSIKGIGQEEEAGKGSYALVINFIEYWNDLDKTDIPNIVKEEIELLKTLATPYEGEDEEEAKEQNKALATSERIESCFATRAEALTTAVKDNKEVLGTITLSSEKKEFGIAKTIQDFTAASADLQQYLKNKKYIGQDGLGITTKILNELGVELAFTNFSELTASLKGLQAEEVSALCALPQAPEKIVKAIDNVENLVILASVELSDEVLGALLQGIKGKINLILQFPEDFSGFLIPLNSNQCKVVCNALNEYITSMVQTADDFLAIIEVLLPDQCFVVFEVFKVHFSEIIKTGEDLGCIVGRLTPEQRMVMFEVFKARLSEIIKTVGQLGDVLSFLTSEQCIATCEAFKADFPEIIKTGKEFGEMLQYLRLEQRRVVCRIFEALFPEIIKTADDFGTVFYYLMFEQCTAVYEAVKAHFPEIIKTSRDFRKVLSYLTLEQRADVYEAFKARFPEIIKTGEDFCQVLEYLTLEQRTDVYEAFKARFPEVIKTAEDIGYVLNHLTSEQCVVLCEAFEAHLYKIIKTGEDFRQVLVCLTPEQRTVVYKVFEARFSEIIKTGEDFCRVLVYLTPEQRTAVYKVFETRFSEIIKTGKEFRQVLVCLTPEQRTAVYKVFEARFSEIIKTGEDLGYVLENLTSKQFIAVCEAFKARFSEIIKTERDYIRMLLVIPEQIVAVNEIFIAHLPLLEPNELYWHLTPEQYAAVCEGAATLTRESSRVAVASTSPLRSQGIFRHNESNVVLDQNDAHPQRMLS